MNRAIALFGLPAMLILLPPAGRADGGASRVTAGPYSFILAQPWSRATPDEEKENEAYTFTLSRDGGNPLAPVLALWMQPDTFTTSAEADAFLARAFPLLRKNAIEWRPVTWPVGGFPAAAQMSILKEGSTFTTTYWFFLRDGLRLHRIMVQLPGRDPLLPDALEQALESLTLQGRRGTAGGTRLQFYAHPSGRFTTLVPASWTLVQGDEKEPDALLADRKAFLAGGPSTVLFFSRTVAEDDIRTAFSRLARERHPDAVPVKLAPAGDGILCDGLAWHDRKAGLATWSFCIVHQGRSYRLDATAPAAALPSEPPPDVRRAIEHLHF